MESAVSPLQPEQTPAVSLRAISSHRALPVLDEEQVLYVLAEISADPAGQQGRHPLNLCLVLDRGRLTNSNFRRGISCRVYRLLFPSIIYLLPGLPMLLTAAAFHHSNTNSIGITIYSDFDKQPDRLS